MTEHICSNCGEDIGYYVLAAIAIKHGGHVFCDDVCLEEWLDSVQQEADMKHDDTGY